MLELALIIEPSNVMDLELNFELLFTSEKYCPNFVCLG